MNLCEEPNLIFAGTKRPSQYNERITRLVAERLAKRAVSAGYAKETQLAEVTEDIESALSDGEDDGYKLTRYLEQRKYWECDRELVELLDDAWCVRSDIHSEWIKQWISATNARPLFDIGAKVFVHARDERTKEQTTSKYEGEIGRIYPNNGTYTVFVEALGHVREGIGTHGLVFPWEQVEEWTR